MSADHYVVETWTNRKKFCYFLIQGTNLKKTSIILGDAFLRNYYVFHDVTEKRIGLYGDYMLYHGSKFNSWDYMLLAAFIIAILLIILLTI